MHITSDGAFTLVLAATNPFDDAAHERRLHANWLSSEGRATGTIFFRFVLPEGEMTQPSTRVVPLTEVLDVIAWTGGERKDNVHGHDA